MSHAKTITLHVKGEYALGDSMTLATRAAFVGGMRAAENGEGSALLDLVFPIESSWGTVGVTLEQHGTRISVAIAANPERVPEQAICLTLMRMLALDLDGEAFLELGKRDKVVGALQRERPGVRMALFPSPYEAAARAIIGHRLNVGQAAKLHARIAADYGVGVEIGGQTIYGFPAPRALAALSAVQGLASNKVEQLRALGVAAGEGWLDTARLKAMTKEAAMAHLQQLAGIGPFSADLILLRGVGDPDAFPASEMRLQRAMAKAYDLGDAPDLATLEQVAERWRPYRSWVGLLLRNHVA